MHPRTAVQSNSSRLALTLVGTLLLHAGACLAGTSAAPDEGEADPTPIGKNPPGSPAMESLSGLDRPREVLSVGVVRTANWIDGFFGDDRSYEESQGSYLKVGLTHLRRDHEGGTWDVRLRGNLNLPRTEERLKLVLESESDEEESDDLTDNLQSQKQTLGLRYTPFESDRWRLHGGAGVRFRSGIDAYVRARLRGQFPGEVWSKRVSERITHFASTGWESVARIDFERELGPRSFLRFASVAVWTEEWDYTEWTQRASLFRNLDRFSVMRYQVGTRSIDEPSLHAVEHYLSVHYRRQIHRDWLFFEVTPRFSFPKEEDFSLVKSILFSIDVILGDPVDR